MQAGIFAWRISSEPVHTILSLANSLAYKYDASTVSLYGNVVNATHGQTVAEVLGNGDASQVFETFALHQSPLTYLSAPTPAGSQSTLEVRVNEIKWRETGNLAALGPADRGYITQTNDADQTSVIFGNGEHGALTPTGSVNIKAVHRYGIGKPGNVKAQQISQLATHPLGLQGVINPLPATGGADRDSADQARRNTPLAVKALDRLVGIADYADFARTFAGIGKAAAARLSDGRRQLVHVTIAGADDIPIDVNSNLYRNLVQALRQYGDPYQPIQVCVRKVELLVISAGIRVLPEYQWESVELLVRAALLDAFSFDSRELGQTAFLSEAVSLMQGIEGVAYVDVQVFDGVAEDISASQLAGLAGTLRLKPFVEADLAQVDPSADPADPCKRIRPAELVFLIPDIPDTLILTEISG
jgi:predicted phage baseplate assembly protein